MLEPRRFDNNRSPPINFFSEDFIAGFQPSNRQSCCSMSVVRRFFCLFVTFDLIFVTLLWLICIVINGENIYKALENQIIHYTIETSLFDIVATAAARFVIIIFFYAFLHINHWIIIAITTSSSCGFLITKVFFYQWPLNQQPFQVLLIIISFVISWFEAWFLDSRMIPQEEYSRTLTEALHSVSAHESTPLLAPFLQSIYGGNFLHAPESYRQSFYSPVDSVDNSDDEDEEYKQLGVDTVIKAYELLESTAWKEEKVTANKDVIYTTVKPIGKVYKLKANVNYSAKKLLHELFYRIEDFPSWNPTLLESKIIRKIDSNTDISYSVSTSGGKGIVASRDFVNLRCWKLVNNSKIIESCHDPSFPVLKVVNHSSRDGDDESSSGEEDKNKKVGSEKVLTKSASDVGINDKKEYKVEIEQQLSKSLGATYVSEDEEPFADAQTEVQSDFDDSKNVFVSAAVSIDYANCPPSNKYIRGNNIVSCWAMRPISGQENSCIFEWILCIDLKGSLPKYILNTAFVSLMTDYMTHLRRHIQELNEHELHEDQPNC